MNGSDDEQHDAHVKVLSYTDERDGTPETSYCEPAKKVVKLRTVQK